VFDWLCQWLTGLTPEERFANHKAGTKAAWVVKRYGLRLLPELFEHLNPMPFEAAAQMEKDLAEDLRRAGYTVTGGHLHVAARRFVRHLTGLSFAP
jgi:hypothetical protein